MAYSVFFGRFSSKAQERGDSQRRQDSGFDAHLARTANLPWAERYFDDGVSGWDADGTGGQHRKHGAFGRLLADIQAKKFPVGATIWFEDLDRFSREDAFVYTVPTLLDILKAGYKVAIGSETFDAQDLKQSWRMVGVVCRGIGNKDFCDKLSQRLQASWAGKRAKGTNTTKEGKPSANCPAWLTLKDGEYEFNAFAKVMKQACLMSINGHGFKFLQKTLGVNESIKCTFHQRSLVGELEHKKRLTRASRVSTGQFSKVYPALLTEAEFQALQVAIKQRTIGGKPKGNRNPGSNLFSDILFADDGCPMFCTYRQVKRAHKDTVSLKVLKRNTRIGGDLEYEPFEAHILQNWLIKLGTLESAPSPNAKELQEIEAKIVQCETRMARARQRMLDMDTDDYDFQNDIALAQNRLKKELLAQRDAKRSEMVQSSDSTLQDAKSLAGALGGLQGQELSDARLRFKGLLAGMVKRIVVAYKCPQKFRYVIELRAGGLFEGSTERAFAFTSTSMEHLRVSMAEWRASQVA